VEVAAKEGKSEEEELRLARSILLHTREGLLRCVHEYGGEVEPAVLAKLAALPPHHAMKPTAPGRKSKPQAVEVAEADIRSQDRADPPETSNRIGGVWDVLRVHQDSE
jgi:hypothetical protein